MAESRPGTAKASNEQEVNVQVLLRCRPLSDQEVAQRVPQAINCNEASREVTMHQFVGGKQISKSFHYDRVYGVDSSQERLFNTSIGPIVDEVMEGFSCTIFAYGQTGTGKTYTMEGGPRNSTDGSNLSAAAGVIPRSIKRIFDYISNSNGDSTVKVSFMELYNEELTDLLSADNEAKLRLLEDKNGINVQGLEEYMVKSTSEIYQILDRGTAKRRTAETQLNKRSSRSHSIFTITIHMREVNDETQEDVIKMGKLYLVDLAGSENISRSGAKEQRAREAGSINQSLLTLGRVITALVENSGHVPYRDSKLTRLLRDSLGGKTKTCIIATIAPTVVCAEETASTLDYAHRAKNIRNRPVVNQKVSKGAMLKEMSMEVEKLRADLIATREKNGVYMSLENYEASELERVQLRAQVANFQSEMAVLREEHECTVTRMQTEHAAEVTALNGQLESVRGELATTKVELEDAREIIREKRFHLVAAQRAEGALASHAQAVTAELKTTANELATLFGKLDGTIAVQAEDRRVLAEVADYARNRMSALEGVVAAMVSEQKEQFEGINAVVAGFKTRKEADCASLSDRVTAVKADVAALQALVAAALAAQATELGAAMQGLTALSGSAASDLCSRIGTASGALGSALAALVESLEAQAAQLAAFAEQQRVATAEALVATQAMVAQARASVSSLRSASEAASGTSAAQTNAARGALTAFATDFSSSISAQESKLMEQIGGLLASFVADRKAAVTGMVTGLSAQLAADNKALAAELGDMATAAGTCLDAMQVDEAALVQRAEATKAANTSGAAALAEGLAGCRAAVEAASEDIAALADDSQQRVRQADGQVAASAGAAAAMVRSAAELLGADVASRTGALADAHDGVSAMVLEQHKADAADADRVHTTATDARQSLKEFSGEYRSSVTETTTKIGSDVQTQLAVQPPVDDVPRREIKVPGPDAVPALQCPPEAVILERYRQQKAEVLARVGDLNSLFEGPASSSLSAKRHPEAENLENDVDAEAALVDVASPRGAKALPAQKSFKRSRIPTGPAAELSDRTNVE